jgi:hypothetical protein
VWFNQLQKRARCLGCKSTVMSVSAPTLAAQRVVQKILGIDITQKDSLDIPHKQGWRH